LSESSYLENEAAYIITLFRQDLIPGYEEKEDYNPEDDNTIELIVCKQRNGMQGSCKLWFDGPSVRLTSRLGDEGERQSSSFDSSDSDDNEF
jgi:replicative DNA helicase